MTASFEKATSEKLRFQEEVNRTNTTIELANRLVKGLEVINKLETLGFVTQLQNFLSLLMVCVFQSENVRWANSLAQFHEQEETLSGDVLLTAAFISYAGSFSKKYRRELLENLWMPFLRSQMVSLLFILLIFKKQSAINSHYHTFVT